VKKARKENVNHKKDLAWIGTSGHVGKVAGDELLAEDCEVRAVAWGAVADLDKAVT
jgi:hypothetical protein